MTLFVWPQIYWPSSLGIKDVRPPLRFLLFLFFPLFSFLKKIKKTLCYLVRPRGPCGPRRGAGRNKGMKTLSAVSAKVSVLSGKPVIQVTNVTVYGVIVNPYRFIDPTSVFFPARFCWLSRAAHVLMPTTRRKCPPPPPPPASAPSLFIYLFILNLPSLTPPIFVSAILLLTAFALSPLVSAAANLTHRRSSSLSPSFHPFEKKGRRKRLFAVKISIYLLIFTALSLPGIPSLYKVEEFCLFM